MHHVTLIVEVARKITAENAAIPYLAQQLDLPWEGPVVYRWDEDLLG